MNAEDLIRTVNKMGAIPFFPEEDDARMAIAEDMADICHDEEQAAWLAKRMRHLYTKWPGVAEMRAVASSKFRPRDGIEANSTLYVDGIPSEKPDEPVALLPSRAGALLEGGTDEFRETIEVVTAATRMGPRRHKPVPPPPDIPEERRITKAAVDAAVEDLHERKAREEIGDAAKVSGQGPAEGL